jgi:hypothetical protein
MTVTQKRILLVVALIGLAYFAIFFFPNALGAKDQAMLAKTSTDEPVLYPYVERMLQNPSSLKDLFVRWVIYGDYHYGWLFYLWSAMVLLPVKALYGMGFANHLQLNILLMRQFVSVLPMALAILWLVYLQTRFKSWLKTLSLLVLMLSIRAVTRMNIQFWHPDALSVLAVVITLFFLERDRLRFGKNFYFAAAACGVSIGIKLAGVFFAGTIAVYLIAGMVKRVINLKRAALNAGLFLLTMAAAIVVTNPFLYNQGARADLIKIQTYKNQELSTAIGYGQDYTADYQLGPEHWTWTFQTSFGSWPMLGFVFISLLAGCVWGPNKLLNRLILTYIIPQSIYLFYFVAPKPEQYWLPVMLPMFSAMLCLPEAIKELLAHRPILKFNQSKLVVPAVTLGVALILSGFLITNITRFYSGFYARYTTGLAVEKNLH